MGSVLSSMRSSFWSFSLRDRIESVSLSMMPGSATRPPQKTLSMAISTGAKEGQGPLVISVVVLLVRIDEDKIKGIPLTLLQESVQCLHGGSQVQFNFMCDLGCRPVTSSDRGPCRIDVTGNQPAVGRQGKCDAERAVAGIHPDLQGLFRAH
jgi:hypothetical protein